MLIRYRPLYIILSYTISVFGIFTTFQLLHHVQHSKKITMLLLLVLSSFTMSTIAIWSMHFIAMEAVRVYSDGSLIQVYYDPWITLASLVCSWAGCFVGLFIWSSGWFLGIRFRYPLVFNPLEINVGKLWKLCTSKKSKVATTKISGLGGPGEMKDFNGQTLKELQTLSTSTTKRGVLHTLPGMYRSGSSPAVSPTSMKSPSVSEISSQGKDLSCWSPQKRRNADWEDIGTPVTPSSETDQSQDNINTEVATNVSSGKRYRSIFSVVNARKKKKRIKVVKKKTNSPHLFQILVGGLFIAFGVMVMHYLGMVAKYSSVTIQYRWYTIVFSACVASITGIAALYLATILRTDLQDLVGSAIAGVATCGTHWTAMSGNTYTAKENPSKPQFYIAADDLTIVIAMISFITCLFLVVFVSNASRKKRSLQRLIDQKTLEIKSEQKKANQILYNMLPASIARRIQNGESTICDTYYNTSIAFIDIVGFTRKATEMSTTDLVRLLNSLFRHYDRLCVKYHCEKIKTIGDSFMVACGCPEENDQHAFCMMNLCIAMIKSLDKFNDMHQSSIEVRVGINSGTVIGGVIGYLKVTFDIWSSTVNFASRLESSGIPGMIQVSPRTYEMLKDNYSPWTERKDVEIKGMGKTTTWLHPVSQRNGAKMFVVPKDT